MEATCWLAISRVAILIVSFKRIAPILGKHMEASAETLLLENIQREKIVYIVKSVSMMSKYLPWECLCLVQASSVKMMLKRRRIASTLYLGVAKEDKFIAHAWLRVGDTVVTGGGELQKYSVVSYFT